MRLAAAVMMSALAAVAADVSIVQAPDTPVRLDRAIRSLGLTQRRAPFSVFSKGAV